jgi:two-component system sensor histidine kinase DesK
VRQRTTRDAPYLWLVYLSALVFQPAFDPDAATSDWVALAVMVAVSLPLYQASLRTRDQHRMSMLAAAMAGLGLPAATVNAGAGVFVVHAAALVGRLEPVRRAWVGIACLALVGVGMLLVSPVPMPWRLLAVLPFPVFVLVIGAASLDDAYSVGIGCIPGDVPNAVPALDVAEAGTRVRVGAEMLR